ncbi:MAG: M14 family zinc carboxypeptidase [Pseudomonadota bacterium]
MAVGIAKRLALLALGLTISAPLLSQQVFTYTENTGPGNRIALGYRVPIPQDSAIPFDGFRSYQSLHARHQDLMLQHDFIQGEIVGQTITGRDIWAYVLSDVDNNTANAGAESSALINGGLHAREWASPELTTGLIEAWADNAGDRHLYDYLIDNVHFTVLPVNNVDGFLQTQRYPSQVLIGQDPSVESWPRDGRMRRKNMRNADEFLQTVGDHLGGIDLNRNNSPFWASSSSSSSNPNSLTYHGNAPFSEPETRALLAAAELALDDRLRWYQDSHSFTQVFFSKLTGNTQRNGIQSRLLITYSNFYDARNSSPRVTSLSMSPRQLEL